MAKKSVYEGGQWAIGGVISRKPPKTTVEAARRREQILSHWLPYAERRAAEQSRWYPGIVSIYRAELVELDRLIAAQTAPAQKRRTRAA